MKSSLNQCAQGSAENSPVIEHQSPLTRKRCINSPAKQASVGSPKVPLQERKYLAQAKSSPRKLHSSSFYPGRTVETPLHRATREWMKLAHVYYYDDTVPCMTLSDDSYMTQLRRVANRLNQILIELTDTKLDDFEKRLLYKLKTTCTIMKHLSDECQQLHHVLEKCQ